MADAAATGGVDDEIAGLQIVAVGNRCQMWIAGNLTGARCDWLMSNPSVEPGLVFRPSVTSDVDGGLFGYIPLIELHRRTTAFADATGIAPMDLVRSRLVNTPIPFYPADWETGMRRWQGVDAAAMWHPLMWLPDAVATRYVTDGHVEDDDSWAVRVAYEATSRGVYDPETGMWQT